MILVLDASPLITLARIGSLELLRLLADHIFIPNAVYMESVSHAQGRHGSTQIAHADWIACRTVTDQQQVTRLRSRIGWGEAEAIMLARQVHADAVVLDDATARRVAEQEGCRVIGLLGLLIQAKQRGIIPAVKPLMDEIRAKGFFIEDQLYATILQQACEEPTR